MLRKSAAVVRAVDQGLSTAALEVLARLPRSDTVAAAVAAHTRFRERVFEKEDRVMLRFRDNYALSLFKNSDASRDDLVAAFAEYEDLDRVARRVLGPDHDVTREFRGNMEAARAKLEAYGPSK